MKAIEVRMEKGGGVMDKKMGGAVILTVIERKRRV